MEKKIVKLAIIRGDSKTACPYGLDIPNACGVAGACVDNMNPIEDVKDLSEEDKEGIIKSNIRILTMNHSEKAKCKFANYIFKDKEMVECNFGDTGAGLGNANINSPAPLAQYLGVGFYSLPLGFYNIDMTYNEGFQNYVNRYFASVDDSRGQENIVKKSNK
jgi:hypothetical protein